MAGTLFAGRTQKFWRGGGHKGVDLEIEDRGLSSSWAPPDVVSLPCSA